MAELSKPKMSRLSRRQFLAVTVAVAGVGAGAYLVFQADSSKVTVEARCFQLPKEPSHNPGFQASDLEEGVLLWASQTGQTFSAYRLNKAGPV